MERHCGWAWSGGSRLGVAIVAAAALAACGSSHPAAVDAAGTPLRQSCAAVAAVLANGPDFSEDPVGYAEAQILPLLQVKTTDAALHTALGQLSAAYRQFEASNGSKAAKAAVAAASARVDAVCPGATS